MKLSFILCSPADGGGNRVIARYASWMLGRGHQVQVISVPDPPRSLRRQLRELLHTRKLPPRPAPSVFAGTAIPHRSLPSSRPVTDDDVPDGDLVIATWWETAHWVSALDPRKGRKVYFIQGYESSIPGQPAERVDATYRLPLAKLVVSRWLADMMRDRFGDPDAALVPNAVDGQVYQSPPRGKQARPTVGFVYALESIKGSDLAVAALEQVRARLPGLRVIAFGRQPPVPGQLPSWVELSLRPGLSQVLEAYRSCDVWLFSSRIEGFGLPILEAMACRTPVVATPTGAAPELLAEAGGRLLAGLDPGPMAAAILEVLGLSAEAWQQMSDRALATARRHDWEVASHAFEAALLRLAERGRAPAAL